MGGYYKYQSVTYTTVGSRPLGPYSNVSSEGYCDYDYAPTRTIVPVATRPHGDDYKYGSPTEAYPARHDDEWLPPQKADELLPKRTTVPVITTRPYGDEYQRSSPTKPYRASDDDDWYWQTRHPQRDDDELLTKRTVVPRVATKPHGSLKSTEAYPARDDPKWHSPQKPQGREPVISTNWRRPPPPPVNNGNYSNREEQKPVDSSAIGNDDKYGRKYQQPAEDRRSGMQMPPNGNNKPIINPSWSSLPRNGNQLSGARNDFPKMTVEMLKHPTSSEADDYRGQRPTANSFAFPNDNYNINNYKPRNMGADRSTIDHREAEKKYNGATV